MVNPRDIAGNAEEEEEAPEQGIKLLLSQLRQLIWNLSTQHSRWKVEHNLDQLHNITIYTPSSTSPQQYLFYINFKEYQA